MNNTLRDNKTIKKKEGNVFNMSIFEKRAPDFLSVIERIELLEAYLKRKVFELRKKKNLK